MPIHCVIIFVLSLALTDAKAEDLNADELKQLVGQWKVVKVEGGELPEEEDRIVTFATKTVTFGTKKTLAFTIDPTKSPKWIDFTSDAPKRTSPGIYKLDKDRLVFVVITSFDSDKPPERPTKFEGKVRGQIVHLERVHKP